MKKVSEYAKHLPFRLNAWLSCKCLQNGLQKTPFFLACRSGHEDAAILLMENGADVTAADFSTKLNCLDVAVENGHK